MLIGENPSRCESHVGYPLRDVTGSCVIIDGITIADQASCTGRGSVVFMMTTVARGLSRVTLVQ